MPTAAMMTGMQGVFLVAAELSRRGFIVSPTSRSAAGADLLVTDQMCKKAWSVQVKTNSKIAKYWLVGKHAISVKSTSHVYVLVNLKGMERPEFVVADSIHVASKTRTKNRKTGSTFWSFYREDRQYDEDQDWGAVFGNPHAVEAAELPPEPPES
ncbi:hypothetical protein EOD42_10410 [Rhodovarius crocodyli]|uniref:PD(D/E)XK endonuclease domain-containing protein n=1 Tax=Rhodovarius crocodyli TaxID=1979269 RepID=A0A437MGM9_9PROT|nr:hypothetical protein [Rhodovarius crocodyli]RVT96810.1 hypothetical protein EOD42_10410 [Rhodovarius crocodyli]